MADWFVADTFAPVCWYSVQRYGIDYIERNNVTTSLTAFWGNFYMVTSEWIIYGSRVNILHWFRLWLELFVALFVESCGYTVEPLSIAGCHLFIAWWSSTRLLFWAPRDLCVTAASFESFLSCVFSAFAFADCPCFVFYNSLWTGFGVQLNSA